MPQVEAVDLKIPTTENEALPFPVCLPRAPVPFAPELFHKVVFCPQSFSINGPCRRSR